MRLLRTLALGIAPALLLMACGRADQASASTPDKKTVMTEQTADTASVRVAVKTTAGDFTVLLYGDTPQHRDNFVKLAKDGYYDGTLFHRVIKDFMIQAGDPDSKTAKPGQMLGSGGPEYKIDAEIVYPQHFHKRGALAAARQGDQVNPAKKSSGSQFYVVTGRKLSAGELGQLEASMKNKQLQGIFNSLAMEHRAEIIDMQQRGDREGLQALQEKLIAETEAKAATEAAPVVTDAMREAYTTVGGAPHLDGDYTVFGEVVEGMDVIDRIEKAATDGHDRPTEDIRILSMKVLD